MDSSTTFVAACAEQHWVRAVNATPPSRNATIAAAVCLPSVEEAFLDFLSGAPLPDQTALRDKWGAGGDGTLHKWRSNVINGLFSAHLEAADAALENHDFRAWSGAFTRALALPPQHATRPAASLVAAVRKCCQYIGEIECATVVAACPELDYGPHLPAPHQSELDAIMGPRYTITRSLPARAVEAVADSAHHSATAPDTLSAALRGCHWPSLRALELLMPWRRDLLERSLSRHIPKRARRHLTMIIEGKPFPTFAPATDLDDVEF